MSFSDQDQQTIAQSGRLRLGLRPEGRGLPQQEAEREIAASVLDGPHHAPSPLRVGSPRVRMEAWRNTVGSKGTRTPGDLQRKRSGVRYAHPVTAASGREGGHLSRPPPVSPLDRFAITPPRQPHLPRRGPPRAGLPPRWQRSSGLPPGRGPPSRSLLTFRAFSWKSALPHKVTRQGKNGRPCGITLWCTRLYVVGFRGLFSRITPKLT